MKFKIHFDKGEQSTFTVQLKSKLKKYLTKSGAEQKRLQFSFKRTVVCSAPEDFWEFLPNMWGAFSFDFGN